MAAALAVAIPLGNHAGTGKFLAPLTAGALKSQCLPRQGTCPPRYTLMIYKKARFWNTFTTDLLLFKLQYDNVQKTQPKRPESDASATLFCHFILKWLTGQILDTELKKVASACIAGYRLTPLNPLKTLDFL